MRILQFFFVFVQSNNDDERVGWARGRVEGMKKEREGGGREREWRMDELRHR